jgi:DNA-binding protein YbaB
MANMLQNAGKLMELQKQAKKIQDELSKEEIVVEKGDIRVVVTGEQKIKEFTVQGVSSKAAIEILNEAIKKSQEASAKKLQNMSGGLGGLMDMMKGM